MPVALINSRLTLIAGQCCFDQMWRVKPGPDPTPWNYAYYRHTFNQLRGGGAATGFAFPWRPTQRSAYWSACLGGRPLDGVDAATAWVAMTPLRLIASGAPKVQTDNAGERVFYDVYGYSHGLVAALTIQSPPRQGESLEGWRDRTRRLRREPCFTIGQVGAAKQTGLSAVALLSAILDWHRTAYYGAVADYIASGDVISIGAVIQGDGVPATFPISEEIHRTLHAVTAWPADWKSVSLPKLKDRMLPVAGANASVGDALYAAPRARTLWRPGLFGLRKAAGTAGRLHTLSCLTHNLVAGAVQAESVRLFAKGFDASPTAQKRIDGDLARTAAQRLDEMRRGVKTYRSSSIQRLIEDPNSKAEVNALLARSGLTQIT